MIHAPGLNRHVSAYLLEARAPKQLAEPGDVLDAYEPIVVVTSVVPEWCSDQSQGWIVIELVEQERKVARVE